MYENFIKTSAPRWQKLLQRGRLGAQELGRIEAAGGRAGMSSWGEMLGGAELARHRALEQKLVRPYGAAHNIQPHNFPGAGPATVHKGVFVDPSSGTFIRQFMDPKQNVAVRGAAATALMAPGVSWPELLMRRLRKPQDAGITRAIQRHELAEAGMLHNGLKPNFVASHRGPGPLLAERMGVKDPDVMQALDQMRAMGKEDSSLMKKLRQYGMVGNYVPTLGGRTHRSLERATSELPGSINEGGFRRMLMGGKAPEEVRTIAPHVQNAASRMQSLSEVQVPSQLMNALPASWQERVRGVQEPVQRNLRNAAAKLQDNLTQVLNQQPTHLNMSPEERQKHLRFLSTFARAPGKPMF